MNNLLLDEKIKLISESLMFVNVSIAYCEDEAVECEEVKVLRDCLERVSKNLEKVLVTV